ncbi:MAG: hybrid sensor histidine kinase/response regulator [Deltaproteobacteria bacterium]|nr:hybrid sensor histidine kinase/response regulator [Deltaproteobacteria bacterium]
MADPTPRPNLLIVDDDPTARQVAQAILSIDNYDFRQAVGGEAALDEIAKQEPDLVLLDVMMPGIDGFEVCHRIRSRPTRAYVPVMLLTALDSATDLARGLNAGADDFISKPAPRIELRARVRSLLRIRRQHLELVEQGSRLELWAKQREDLVRMVVHDLRSPVTAIQLGASTLLGPEHKIGPAVRRDLEMIREEARRVGRYLEEMLLLARQEEGKLSLSFETVDLTPITQETLASLRHVAGARGVRLKEVLPQAPAEVHGDPALLRRVVDNLVTNAIKFSPANGTVEVHIARHKDHAVLEVLDEGPGVPEQARSRIFEKYEIVKVREAGGPQTGLGLAFCRMVVEAHGGTVSCHGRKGPGSRFIVTLPAGAP